MLYNEVIAGRARECTQCRHCLSEHHTTETCPDVPVSPFHFPMAPAEAGLPAISFGVQRGTGNSAGNITRTGASTANVSTLTRAACATAPTQQRHVPSTATATPTHGGSPSQPGCPDHKRQRSFGRPHAVILGYSQSPLALIIVYPCIISIYLSVYSFQSIIYMSLSSWFRPVKGVILRWVRYAYTSLTGGHMHDPDVILFTI